MLSSDERAYLLRCARRALADAVEGRDFVEDGPPSEWTALRGEGGVFVTCKTGGMLRGCLGCFRHPPPLYRTVAKYTALSALEDPRFAGRRIRPDELERVRLEISVLSPLSPCADPMAVVAGRDGIYLEGHGRSGCFLPQVAEETGWGVEEFWERCCVDKAGLPSGAWRRDPSLRLWTFTAEVFGEEAR